MCYKYGILTPFGIKLLKFKPNIFLIGVGVPPKESLHVKAASF